MADPIVASQLDGVGSYEECFNPVETITNKLPLHIKEKWVNALRSGEYTQIKGNYYRGDKCFCVMGVLGAVTGYDFTFNKGNFDILFTEWLVMKNIQFFINDDRFATPYVLIEGEHYPLSVMNDDSDVSFAQFADLIESQLEGI
jgi:hypothetical protein